MTRYPANAITNQFSFGSPFGPAIRQFGAGDDSVRVLLVAIHRGPQPAAFLGSHPLRRLQVLLATPGDEVELERTGAKAQPAAGAQTQVLPQMPATPGSLRLRPRLVQGEILSDDDGRLFERAGNRIRPLQRLFSGPHGEVLELPAEPRRETDAEAPAPDAETPKAEAQAEPRAEAAPEQRRHSQRPIRRQPQPHPMRAMRAAQQAPAPHHQTRNGGADNQRQEQASAAGHRLTIRQNDIQQQSPATPLGASGGLKTAIPDQWIRQWEFQISREEAIYDMRAAASFRASPLAFIRDLTGWFGNRRARRKWQALLAGKKPDEQLWAVRPPRGLIGSPAVREWARQTLEQAGYDTSAMLAEWEIFWRRKGL